MQLKPNREETWELLSFRSFGEKRVARGLEWDDGGGDDMILVLLAVAEGDANAISVLGFVAASFSSPYPPMSREASRETDREGWGRRRRRLSQMKKGKEQQSGSGD